MVDAHRVGDGFTIDLLTFFLIFLTISGNIYQPAIGWHGIQTWACYEMPPL